MYKIVTLDDNRLMSYVATNDWAVEYVKDQWTAAPFGTYLWVYDSYPKRWQYCVLGNNIQIWKCECEDVIMPYELAFTHSKEWKAYWTMLNAGKSPFYGAITNESNVRWAKRVKLIHRADIKTFWGDECF